MARHIDKTPERPGHAEWLVYMAANDRWQIAMDEYNKALVAMEAAWERYAAARKGANAATKGE